MKKILTVITVIAITSAISYQATAAIKQTCKTTCTSILWGAWTSCETTCVKEEG